MRASGLSAPTVTNVVKDLIAANLIEPLGEGASSGGRPPDMIRFRAERGCILAVQITSDGLGFLLTDLNGRELERHNHSLLGHATTPSAVCALLLTELRRILRKHKKRVEELLALVVGVPAITNVASGVVFSISTLEGWRAVPLRAMLSEVLDCLVLIENDTNLAALGERYQGAAQNEENFALISIGANVRAGTVSNSRTHHGAQWSAGETDYPRLPEILRRPPTLHEFGELEGVLTSSGILARWQQVEPERHHPSRRGPEPITAQDILTMSQTGDTAAQEIVLQRASLVADIIVNLSLILNPNLILLAGEVGSHPAMVTSVQTQLQGSEFAVTTVAVATLGDNAVLWGAISIALENIPAILLPAPSE